MSILASFDITTGEIESLYKARPKYALPTNVVLIDEDDKNFDNYSGLTHYIVNDAIAVRPEQLTSLDVTTLVANGVDEASFTNLPDPCTLCVTGMGEITQETIVGGSEKLIFGLPGEYAVLIMAFPYTNLKVIIHGT